VGDDVVRVSGHRLDFDVDMMTQTKASFEMRDKLQTRRLSTKIEYQWTEEEERQNPAIQYTTGTMQRSCEGRQAWMGAEGKESENRENDRISMWWLLGLILRREKAAISVGTNT
jgi:hypothetical protein